MLLRRLNGGVGRQVVRLSWVHVFPFYPYPCTPPLLRLSPSSTSIGFVTAIFAIVHSSVVADLVLVLPCLQVRSGCSTNAIGVLSAVCSTTHTRMSHRNSPVRGLHERTECKHLLFLQFTAARAHVVLSGLLSLVHAVVSRAFADLIVPQQHRKWPSLSTSMPTWRRSCACRAIA